MFPVINFAMVALGGAIGSCIRYGIGLLETAVRIKGLGTFIVNVSGCFIIGLLYVISSSCNFSDRLRVFLFVGLLGGFTTFSSYVLDAVTMFQSGETLKAVGYFLLTNVVGVLMALTGVYLGNVIIKNVM